MAAASDAEKENTTAFVVDFGETEADAGGSLQGAFAKYRRDKAKALELRAGPAKVTRTPEQKEELRHKFLEQCRSYMGVVRRSRPFAVVLCLRPDASINSSPRPLAAPVAAIQEEVLRGGNARV